MRRSLGHTPSSSSHCKQNVSITTEKPPGSYRVAFLFVRGPGALGRPIFANGGATKPGTSTNARASERSAKFPEAKSTHPGSSAVCQLLLTSTLDVAPPSKLTGCLGRTIAKIPPPFRRSKCQMMNFKSSTSEFREITKHSTYITTSLMFLMVFNRLRNNPLGIFAYARKHRWYRHDWQQKIVSHRIFNFMGIR